MSFRKKKIKKARKMSKNIKNLNHKKEKIGIYFK